MGFHSGWKKQNVFLNFCFVVFAVKDPFLPPSVRPPPSSRNYAVWWCIPTEGERLGGVGDGLMVAFLYFDCGSLNGVSFCFFPSPRRRLAQVRCMLGHTEGGG